MSDTPIRDRHHLPPGFDGPIRLKFNAFLDDVVAPLERELAALKGTQSESTESNEGYPGIAHDAETMRTELLRLSDWFKERDDRPGHKAQQIHIGMALDAAARKKPSAAASVDLESIVNVVATEWKIGGMGPDTMYGEFAIEVAKRALGSRSATASMPEGFQRCPIGLDASPTICSAATCTPCQAWREYSGDDQVNARRYRYLRKYGWDLITLPPTNAHNEEAATGPAKLDELLDLSIAHIEKHAADSSSKEKP